MYSHNIFLPQAELQDHVRYFWTTNIKIEGENKLAVHSYVDDSCGIIFQIGNKSAVERYDKEIPVAMVNGLLTTPNVSWCHTSFTAFGVALYPFALKEIFGIDCRHLTDEILPIDHFESFLAEQMCNAQTTAQRIDIITRFILKALAENKSSTALARQAYDYVYQHRGLITVNDIVKRFNINEKFLQRVFQENIGVPPRHLIKVVRLQQALQLIRKKQLKTLTEISYHLQYSDQAHFIRHVKQLTGYSPGVIKRNYQESVVNLLIENMA